MQYLHIKMIVSGIISILVPILKQCFDILSENYKQNDELYISVKSNQKLLNFSL